jgi:hypothetical protein
MISIARLLVVASIIFLSTLVVGGIYTDTARADCVNGRC